MRRFLGHTLGAAALTVIAYATVIVTASTAIDWYGLDMLSRSGYYIIWVTLLVLVGGAAAMFHLGFFPACAGAALTAAVLTAAGFAATPGVPLALRLQWWAYASSLAIAFLGVAAGHLAGQRWKHVRTKSE